MAYQKKYYAPYVTIDGKSCVVEIWQNTATPLTAEEVILTAVPFMIEIPTMEKFNPVWGSGCEINLLSETNMKFFDGLYHVDKKEFMIKHYVNESINWLGYLNSELARESYSYMNNYPVQVTGNDGFALLERIQFLQSDGNIYKGAKSLFELICICIDRIGLPFYSINIALSTTTEFTITAESTLFHQTYIDCANFYKEDGTAETMRKVLESILTPHAARIVQTGGALYIDDMHIRASGGSITYKSYYNTGTAYEYDGIMEFDNTELIPSIGYMGTGSEIEISGGKNKQVVSYSPYPIKTLLPKTLSSLSEFSGSIPSTWTAGSGRTYKTLTGHNALTIYSPASFELSYSPTGINRKPETLTDACVNVRWPAGTAGTKIIELQANPSINLRGGTTGVTPGALRRSFTGVGIKIGGQIFFERHWGSTDGQVAEARIKAILRVGNKSTTLAGSRPVWNTYPATPQLYGSIIIRNLADYSDISGKWVDIMSANFPECFSVNDIDLSGDVYLDIYSDIEYVDLNGTVWTNTAVHNASIRLRNLEVTIIEAETRKELGDADIEYIGYLDPLYKEEADKVELIVGTDVAYADRGKILYLDSIYKTLKTWTRAGQTFCIEKLLLNSLSSNYRTGYLTLNNMKLSNSFSPLNTLTDDYTGDKLFQIQEMRVNHYDNLIECSLVEISPDQLTIE